VLSQVWLKAMGLLHRQFQCHPRKEKRRICSCCRGQGQRCRRSQRALSCRPSSSPKSGLCKTSPILRLQNSTHSEASNSMAGTRGRLHVFTAAASSFRDPCSCIRSSAEKGPRPEHASTDSVRSGPARKAKPSLAKEQNIYLWQQTCNRHCRCSGSNLNILSSTLSKNAN